MKKKLLIFLTLLVLMVCLFALSVSASTWLPDDTIFEIRDTSWSIDLKYVTNHFNPNSITFESTLEEDIGIIYSNDIDNVYGYINIEWWHEYFSAQGVVDNNTFVAAINNAEELGYWTDMFSFFLGERDEYRQGFLNSYLAYVEKLNASGYQDGYKAGQASGYEQGYNEAENYWLESDNCKALLNAKYKEGCVDGENEYKTGEDFKAALQAEYDKGLEAGGSNEPFNIVSVVSFVATLCTIVGFVLLIFRNKKRGGFKK